MSAPAHEYFAKDQTLTGAKDRMVRVYARLPGLSPQSRSIARCLPPGGRMLDAGCGEGLTLQLAHALQPTATFAGIDISDNLGDVRAALPVDFHIVDLNADKLPFPDDTFDFINCSHVIEHLVAPLNAASEFMRVLKPGGYVYVETPHTRWTMLPRIPFLISDRGVYNFWDDPTHIRPHTRASLRSLVEMVGLECERTGHARKFAHMGVLPLAIFSMRSDYKVAVLQAIFGLWCYALARKPAAR
jgi:ubiquinone/menaquinone biosynthesis C-methylase UbiE